MNCKIPTPYLANCDWQHSQSRPHPILRYHTDYWSTSKYSANRTVYRQNPAHINDTRSSSPTFGLYLTVVSGGVFSSPDSYSSLTVLIFERRMLCLSSSSPSDDDNDDRERSASWVEDIGLRQNLQDEDGSESVKKTEFVSK